MLKIAKIAIICNSIGYTNFSLWELVNGEYPYLIASHWSPLGISAPHYIMNNGSIAVVQTITIYLYFNTPFWIFWVLLIVNLYLIIKISKEAKPNK
jgi:hypothetical protein